MKFVFTFLLNKIDIYQFFMEVIMSHKTETEYEMEH